ncbi:hypothetical protein JOC86_001868 [Bacillus pakistanensis]|uniref:Uncharacterized protein n=1 Tax=Rossellomorea pakistanensis TaxID=992288 RepID=A0ABS2NCM3_9BACI|nr:hypothetical protein [Bacillus pakistanensis]MBM7585326.1 hypothetical protein [Bacillus pakistanensis]
MIKNTKLFCLALLFLIATMIVKFPFPHEAPFSDRIAGVLNIPNKSINGLNYGGIAAVLLLITSLFLLVKSIEKYHGRFVLLAIIIVLFFPSFIVNTYQKTMAKGIYAVSYERDLSKCHFKLSNESTLHGVCELSFVNHSKDDVQFAIEFYEKYDERIAMETLMNNNGSSVIKLRGNERKNVKIEKQIDVSQMENYIESGSTTDVNIKMKSGKKSRKL